MAGLDFEFCGVRATALPSGALWLAEERLLAVADMHLGKSDRMARRGGALLPPYETRETLDRLSGIVEAVSPRVVICLGDSFDDLDAQEAMDGDAASALARMMAGRRWIWVQGNHDPGPIELGGEHLAEARAAGLVFRHIARADAAPGEVSGHYHPKARLGRARRACFLADAARVILPAFGCYTGGLDVSHPAFAGLFRPNARVLMLGRKVVEAPRAACG